MEDIIKQWNKDNYFGDYLYKVEPLMFKFDGIQSTDIVFDVGGYHGQWSDCMLKLYNCTSYLFEPEQDSYTFCNNKYKENPNMKVFQHGLGNITTQSTIYVCDDAKNVSSIWNNPQHGTVTPQQFEIIEFKTFCKEHNIDHIKVLKINIEGAEYDLLKNILDSSVTIDIVIVQFHDFFPEAKQLREDIITKLQQTHKSKFSYPFVWECWSLKE